MKKINLTKKQMENLSEFQAGQMDILNWLERQFNREFNEIVDQEPFKIYQKNEEEFLFTQARLESIKHYIKQIQSLKKSIFKEN